MVSHIGLVVAAMQHALCSTASMCNMTSPDMMKPSVNVLSSGQHQPEPGHSHQDMRKWALSAAASKPFYSCFPVHSGPTLQLC